MSIPRKCGVCHEWTYGSDIHTCKPAWNVWEEGEADADNTEEFRIIHANTAERAAESCCEEMNDDGPQHRRMYVRKPGSAKAAELFEVRYEQTIEYSARRTT